MREIRSALQRQVLIHVLFQAVLTDEYLKEVLLGRNLSRIHHAAGLPSLGFDFVPYFRARFCTPMTVLLTLLARGLAAVQTSLDDASGFSS